MAPFGSWGRVNRYNLDPVARKPGLFILWLYGACSVTEPSLVSFHARAENTGESAF